MRRGDHPAAISPLLFDGLQAAYLGFLVASVGADR